jgi:hypothetical protein
MTENGTGGTNGEGEGEKKSKGGFVSAPLIPPVYRANGTELFSFENNSEEFDVCLIDFLKLVRSVTTFG